MKKLLILTGAVLVFAACTDTGANTQAGDQQEVATATEESKTYTVSGEKSTVTWLGSKVTGSTHEGNVGVTEGQFSVKEGIIAAGRFVLDMNTIQNTDDMDEEMKAKLVGHLKSPDFFNVAEYPNVVFEITSSSADSLTGNLSIKGITHSITIPYHMDSDDSAVKAHSSFSIDRSAWDVQYGSTSFFDELGDKAINNAIQFDVSLVADKG